jgi:hypothetical protein
MHTAGAVKVVGALSTSTQVASGSGKFYGASLVSGTGVSTYYAYFFDYLLSTKVGSTANSAALGILKSSTSTTSTDMNKMPNLSLPIPFTNGLYMLSVSSTASSDNLILAYITQRS